MILLNKFIVNYNFNNELYAPEGFPRYCLDEPCRIGKTHKIFLSICDRYNAAYISGIFALKSVAYSRGRIKGIEMIIREYDPTYKLFVIDTNSSVRELIEVNHKGFTRQPILYFICDV